MNWSKSAVAVLSVALAVTSGAQVVPLKPDRVHDDTAAIQARLEPAHFAPR